MKQTLKNNDLKMIRAEILADKVNVLATQNRALEAKNSLLEKRLHGFQKYFLDSKDVIFRDTLDFVFGSKLENERRYLSNDGLTERRDAFLNLVNKIPELDPIKTLYPHGGNPGAPRVLLYIGGGIGDLFQMSHAVNIARSIFPAAVMFAASENKLIYDVFKNNPSVYASLHIRSELRVELLGAFSLFDVFDVILDVRYGVVPIYPPLSRINPLVKRKIESAAAPSYSFNLASWPTLNNEFISYLIEDEKDYFSCISSALAQSNLIEPVVHFYPDGLDKVTDAINGQKLILVGVGSDPKMSNQNNRSTKTLPMSTVNKMVAKLQAKGFLVCQIGVKGEPALEGVDLDFRGKLSISELGALMKVSTAVVSCEGGMAHMASAVGVRSVVNFGPTQKEFFSYKDNVNISKGACKDCMWLSLDWMKNCINSERPYECTTLISHDELVDGVIKIQNDQESKYKIKTVRSSDKINDSFVINEGLKNSARYILDKALLNDFGVSF